MITTALGAWLVVGLVVGWAAVALGIRAVLGTQHGRRSRHGGAR